MRGHSILRRLLVPAAVFLLLLPPISCLIFQRAAEQYALTLAQRELHALQQEVLPLIEEAFGEGPGTDKQERRRSKQIEQEQSKAFLAQVKPLLKKRGGSADMLILNYRLEPVYPRDEEELAETKYLAAACAALLTQIPEGERADGVRSITTQEDGRTYLVDCYEVESEANLRAKYLLTYSPVLGIGGWIGGASALVLGISAFFALLALGMLWMTARGISGPLRRLCQEAERIGGGDFAEITPSFTLCELEELRNAMNGMSQKLLHAEDAQRDFFQNVSHELRTPLMSIGGYAQGIEHGVFPQPELAAKTILSESARLTELVNGLLTLSRMESGQNPPILGAVRISDPLEDCLDRVSGLALRTGIFLSLKPFDRGLQAYGEEELVAKVLENLLTNAIRYAKSTVAISVTAGAGELSIAVLDDGAGIAQEDLPHLFERCYKGRGGNFGIGLAIARSAARSMGGSLKGENAPAGGALFTLTLPGC